MGRRDIANYGKRFSTEYQPAGRGRPKGSLNARTILHAFLAAQEPPQPEAHISRLLDVLLGKRRARPHKRRLRRYLRGIMRRFLSCARVCACAD